MLARAMIGAHGGLDRWRQIDEVVARTVHDGELWAAKGHATTLSEARVAVGTKKEWASLSPFGAHGFGARFAPDKVALEGRRGEELHSMENPRASFRNHVRDTPWSSLQMVYFAGCTVWTYFNLPFLAAWPGVESEEVAPWIDGRETWRRLVLKFPPEVATYCARQTLYLDDAGLIRRHDFDLEISDQMAAALYLDGHIEVAGIWFPTRARAFPRTTDNRAGEGQAFFSMKASEFFLG